jgi:hypothetical protein
MHYVPCQEDEIEDQGSWGSSRQGRESKGSSTKESKGSSQNGRPRIGSPGVPRPPTDKKKKKTPQKTAKKIRGLMARAFAKQQPPYTEQDALLTVIHCGPHQDDAASVLTIAPKSPSINSPTTPSSHQASPVRYSSLSGDVLVNARHETSPGTFKAMDIDQGKDADNPFQDDDTSISHARRRELLRTKAQEEIRARMSYSVWQCIIAIWVYIILSVLCFSGWLEDEWTLLESSYFAVVTFTTIGQ